MLVNSSQFQTLNQAQGLHWFEVALILYIRIIIIIVIIIIIMDRLVGLVVSMSDYWSWGRGFDPRHFHNFKCGLGLERSPSSLATTG